MDAPGLIPICPRCGYDLSGQPATWTDRCPLDATCSECGTVTPWADVFDPERVEIRWLVEHARSWRALARRTAPTLARMILPWVFWRRVDVRVRTHPMVLVRWIVLLAASLHLLSVVPFGIAYGMLDGGYWMSTAGAGEYLSDLTRREAIDQTLNGLCYPVCTFYGMSPAWHDAYGGRQLLLMFRIQLGIGLTWSLVLFALPVTRRLAKLRPAHILRSLLLQIGVVTILCMAFRVCIPIGESVATGYAFGYAIAGLFLATVVWCLVWWIFALRVGWRVRSWALAVLGSAAALIGGLVFVMIELSVSYLYSML